MCVWICSVCIKKANTQHIRFPDLLVHLWGWGRWALRGLGQLIDWNKDELNRNSWYAENKQAEVGVVLPLLLNVGTDTKS